MNEMVAELIDEMDRKTKTNTFEVEWLKSQAVRIARTLTRMPGAGGRDGALSRKAVECGIVQSGPVGGLPDCCSCFSDSAMDLRNRIVEMTKRISGSGIVRMWDTMDNLGLNKNERPDRWKRVRNEACMQAGTVMAACDLSEDDDINSLPYPVYIRYDEVRDAEYLCRVMAAMLGTKMQ